jgi:SAM-dependent methyltransferase
MECMPDARHFEVHAEVYERARPPYPEALWARLRELELLQPGTRVLELGAGTGQATEPPGLQSWLSSPVRPWLSGCVGACP